MDLYDLGSASDLSIGAGGVSYYGHINKFGRNPDIDTAPTSAAGSI